MTMAVTRIKPLYDKTGRLKGYVDKYTGEEYGFPVIIGRKKNPYGKGWVMNSQEALEIVAKDKEIKGETYRVLFFICARLDFENWIHISVNEISEELEMYRQNVSKAMKLLEKKEIILKGPKMGRSYAFMLNPDFGWKGKVKNLEEYRQEKEKIENTNKTDKIKNHKIEALSKKYNIPIEEIKNCI